MLLNKYSGISEILYIYLEKYKKYIAISMSNNNNNSNKFYCLNEE